MEICVYREEYSEFNEQKRRQTSTEPTKTEREMMKNRTTKQFRYFSHIKGYKAMMKTIIYGIVKGKEER